MFLVLSTVSFYHEVEIPADMLQTNDETLSILIPHANHVIVVYWNGEKIFESGILDANGKIILDGSIRSKVIPLPSRLVKSGKNQLLVHLTSHKEIHNSWRK